MTRELLVDELRGFLVVGEKGRNVWFLATKIISREAAVEAPCLELLLRGIERQAQDLFGRG